MTTIPISPVYPKTIKVAIVLQIITTLFLLTIQDDGTVAKSGGAAMFGFWIGVAVTILRRPRNPSHLDMLYIRWGYLPMLIVGIACAPFMGVLRHWLAVHLFN